jgi:hypothetical protein
MQDPNTREHECAPASAVTALPSTCSAGSPVAWMRTHRSLPAQMMLPTGPRLKHYKEKLANALTAPLCAMDLCNLLGEDHAHYPNVKCMQPEPPSDLSSARLQPTNQNKEKPPKCKTKMRMKSSMHMSLCQGDLDLNICFLVPCNLKTTQRTLQEQ